jgi:signal transduction histidine kinase
MDPVCAFFSAHIIEIYFLYGLAFFVTGVVVLLEASHSPAAPLARALPLLGVFGLVHGFHEWLEMFQSLAASPTGLSPRLVRLSVLILSFVPLLEFGLRLLTLHRGKRWRSARWIVLGVFVAGAAIAWRRWHTEHLDWIAAVDAWGRYSLAIPGALLAGAGLLKHRGLADHRQVRVSRDLMVVGMAFIVYAVPGQIFVGASPLPPSNVVNEQMFMQYLHFPVQLLRTGASVLILVFVVRSVRLFQWRKQCQLEELTQARLDAQRRLTEQMAAGEALRREILHQTVQAQEEERRYIARELHDEAGQALTAIAYELAALEADLPPTSPEHHDVVRERTTALRYLTQEVISNLRRLTNRLRPTSLDELGLAPALISYADECSDRFPFRVEVEIDGRRRRLPPEVETTLYRMSQEALTNVARHARASHVRIQLRFGEGKVFLGIADDGIGMRTQSAARTTGLSRGWGLAGIRERIELLAGDLDVRSSPGEGTELVAAIPVPGLLDVG